MTINNINDVFKKANEEYIRNFNNGQEGFHSETTIFRYPFKVEDFDKFIGQEFVIPGYNNLTVKLKAVREVSKGFFVAELNGGMVINFNFLRDKDGKNLEDLIRK
jgi:hypothetical protein